MEVILSFENFHKKMSKNSSKVNVLMEMQTRKQTETQANFFPLEKALCKVQLSVSHFLFNLYIYL